MSASMVFAGDVEGGPGVEVSCRPADWELLSGESARLSITSGGAAACRVCPSRYPEVMSANENSSSGTKRSRLNLLAQTLQNRRLVQKCQRKRISLLPHSQQKFGLYTAQFSAFNFELLLKRRVMNCI